MKVNVTRVEITLAPNRHRHMTDTPVTWRRALKACTRKRSSHEKIWSRILPQGYSSISVDSIDMSTVNNDVVDVNTVDNLSIGTERSETPAGSFSIRYPEAEPLVQPAPRSPPPIVPPLVLPMVLSLYSGAEYVVAARHTIPEVRPTASAPAENRLSLRMR